MIASADSTAALESSSTSSAIGAANSISRAASEMSVLTDCKPGVSTTVRSRSRSEDSWTSIIAASSAGIGSVVGIIPFASNGTACLVPLRATTSTRSAGPYRNWVTTRVHSPAAVGATRRPINALTRVDFPALRRPATATRSGCPNRPATSSTTGRDALLTLPASSSHMLATLVVSCPATMVPVSALSCSLVGPDGPGLRRSAALRPPTPVCGIEASAIS